MLWGNIAAMAAVVIVVLIAIWQGIAAYTRHGVSVEVPGVVGKMEADARYELSRMELTAIVVDSSYHKHLPAGSILDQSPAAGAHVKPGREIYLTVNTARTPTLAIPDIADNSSLREAEARLRAMGFKLGPPEHVAGDKDWVYGVKCMGRNVYAGERVPVDAVIVLQVGSYADEDELDMLSDDEEDADDDTTPSDTDTDI